MTEEQQKKIQELKRANDLFRSYDAHIAYDEIDWLISIIDSQEGALEAAAEGLKGATAIANIAGSRIKELERKNERLKKEIEQLCPIGNLDLVTSLQVEKEHMQDEIEFLKKQLQGIGVEQYYTLQRKWQEQAREVEQLRSQLKQAVVVAEKIKKHYCEEEYYGYVDELLSHIQGKESPKRKYGELMGNWLEERCPKCNSYLLGNKVGDKWCSLVGCDYQGKECKTCHGVGEVTLTVNRQPDYFENIPCPDCQGKEGEKE